MAAKSADLYARIEPDVKKQAESCQYNERNELPKRIVTRDTAS